MLLLVSWIIAVQGYNVRWAGNVTLSDAHDDYTFRAASLLALSTGVWNSVTYSSVSVSFGDDSSTNNGVYGSFYTPGFLAFPPYQPPSSYIAFFNNSASWSGDSANAPYSGDVSGAAGYVATSYTKLEEVNSSGFVFQTIDLGSLSWSLNPIGPVPLQDGLAYAVFTGTKTGVANFSVKFVFVIADRSGVLPSGVIMTPQTVETILEIYQFPYTNTANSVRLTLVVAAASVNYTANGTYTHLDEYHRWRYGNNQGAVYADFALSSINDDQTKSVTIQTCGGGITDLNNTYLQLQLQAIVQSSIQVLVQQITFAPGATNITYDPTVGAGSGPVVSSADSSLSAGAKAGIAIGVVIFFMIILFIGYRFYKKRKTPTSDIDVTKPGYATLGSS